MAALGTNPRPRGDDDAQSSQRSRSLARPGWSRCINDVALEPGVIVATRFEIGYDMNIRILVHRYLFRECVLVLVLGAGFGMWLLGLRNLLPSFEGWRKNDAVLNQIAFRYFWNSPILQFPLSSTPNLGVGWGTGLHSNGENLPIALLSKPMA